MLIKATQKYIRITPRKIRLVVDRVKHLRPKQAIEELSFIRKRAALPLTKVIKQAMANAIKNANVSEDSLQFENITIGGGPILKRWRAVSRGRAHPIKKRTSHITVILKSEETQVKDQKKEGKWDRK